MKKDDHTPEALGRFLAGRYHSASSQYGGGTKISHAKFMHSLGKKQNFGNEPAGIGERHTGKRRGNWMS